MENMHAVIGIMVIIVIMIIKRFPKGIYLDIGSGIDKICTKRESRGWNTSYEYLKDVLKDCIPENWEDDKYNHLYAEARHKLGIHFTELDIYNNNLPILWVALFIFFKNYSLYE